MLYVENIGPFSLFFLNASNNLVLIPLQLGTFHPHFQTTRTNNKQVLLTLCEVLKENAVRITDGQLFNEPSFDFRDEFKYSELSRFALQTWIQHKKSKRERQFIVRLFLSQSYTCRSQKRSPGRATGCFSCYPKMKALKILILFSKGFVDLISFKSSHK